MNSTGGAHHPRTERRERWVRGRVAALLPDARIVVVNADERVEIGGVSLDVSPTTVVGGDLVEVRIEEELAASRPDSATSGTPVAATTTARALEVKLVRRPTREPWARGAESYRTLSGGLGARLRARATALGAVRDYFRANDFLEVETPALATCPGLDLHLAGFAVHEPPRRSRGDADQSGRRPSIPPGLLDPLAFLITSPEYHMKRLLVGGVRRCFQVARCFRAGEVGSRHEPEFTMLEWYRAWSGIDDVIADTEQVVRAVARGVAQVGPPSRADGDALSNAVLNTAFGPVSLETPFDRMTVRQAFARWASDVGDPIALAERDEEAFFYTLTSRVEQHLGTERPTFLLGWPAALASLARIDPADRGLCLRFELYVHGIELCNGFDELTDVEEQRRRFERDVAERRARGLPEYPIDERLLDALAEGMPPSAGNALGLDRLVALALGVRSIADVMAFPSDTR